MRAMWCSRMCHEPSYLITAQLNRVCACFQSLHRCCSESRVTTLQPRATTHAPPLRQTPPGDNASASDSCTHVPCSQVISYAEFEACYGLIQDMLVERSLLAAGMTRGRMVALLLYAVLLLLLIFVFIFVGVAAFTGAGTLGAVVNSALVRLGVCGVVWCVVCLHVCVVLCCACAMLLRRFSECPQGCVLMLPAVMRVLMCMACVCHPTHPAGRWRGYCAQPQEGQGGARCDGQGECPTRCVLARAQHGPHRSCCTWWHAAPSPCALVTCGHTFHARLLIACTCTGTKAVPGHASSRHAM